MGELLPDDEFSAAFAAGSLHPCLRVLGELHRSMCASEKCSLSMGEAIAGCYLAREASVPLSDTCLEEILQRVDHHVSTACDVSAEGASTINEIPGSLQSLVVNAERKTSWQSVAPGCDVLSLTSSLATETAPPSYDLILLRAEPGSVVDEHVHGGEEYSLILSGRVSDEHGSYEAGQLMRYAKQSRHRPTATSDQICYVLSAVERI